MSFQDSAHTFETPPAASKSGYHSGKTTGTTCSISPRSAQITLGLRSRPDPVLRFSRYFLGTSKVFEIPNTRATGKGPGSRVSKLHSKLCSVKCGEAGPGQEDEGGSVATITEAWPRSRTKSRAGTRELPYWLDCL